jgi:hypothetical protein
MTDYAFEEDLEVRSVPAGSDLSAKQYYAVLVNSSGQLALCGDDGVAYGILQDKPAAAGRAGKVAVAGVSKCVLGGTVAAGAVVSVDGNGKIVSIATGDGRMVGICRVGGSSGQIGCIEVRPGLIVSSVA